MSERFDFNKRSVHIAIVQSPRKIQISNQLIEIARLETIQIEGDRLVVLSMNPTPHLNLRNPFHAHCIQPREEREQRGGIHGA